MDKLMSQFVEFAPDQYVNMDHVVKAAVSISTSEISEDGEWRHDCLSTVFYFNSKQVIALRLIDGSIVRSAGIEQYDSSYYAGVWEALNPGIDFEFPDLEVEDLFAVRPVNVTREAIKEQFVNNN